MGRRQSPLDDLALSDSFWPGRSVLVTGAAGLLGGWVVRRLAQAGAKVVGLDIKWAHGVILMEDDRFEQVDGDVREAELLATLIRDRGIDTVIHLAAQAIVGRADEDPVETFEHNILGTWALLEACRKNPSVTSIVVASSDKAYGDHGGEPYVESMALEGRHPYAASKTCTDVLAQTYAESYGLPVAISRCGNMYGGGDTEWSRIVPGTIRSVLQGERPIVRSDGAFVRDYFYVEDSADAAITLARMVAERPELAGEAFNFASETHLSVLELVGRILDVMGSELEPDVRNEAVNEIRDQRVSARKAHEVLGWSPGHTLDQGLSLTVDWYRTHLGAPA
jgi:CDP-glucose 4,6-dehydratase